MSAYDEKDDDSNRIKEWKDVTPTTGVFSNELLLANSPVLGDWQIRVEVMDVVYSAQHFQRNLYFGCNLISYIL